jgi:hypothetical protein
MVNSPNGQRVEDGRFKLNVSKDHTTIKVQKSSKLLCAPVRLLQKEKDEQINKKHNQGWELLVHEVAPPAAGSWMDARSGLV